MGFLAEDFLLSTDAHGLARMGFLAEAFISSTDGHGLARRASCGSFVIQRLAWMGFLTEAFVFAKAPLGGLGAKDLLFNTISRASRFLAEVVLSTD
jgi:hypothetical protein